MNAILILLITVAASVSATTVTIPASVSTFLITPDRAQGVTYCDTFPRHTTLVNTVDYSYGFLANNYVDTYIKFDISSIPGSASISSAQAYVYADDPAFNGHKIKAYKINSNVWYNATYLCTSRNNFVSNFQDQEIINQVLTLNVATILQDSVNAGRIQTLE